MADMRTWGIKSLLQGLEGVPALVILYSFYVGFLTDAWKAYPNSQNKYIVSVSGSFWSNPEVKVPATKFQAPL